MYRWRGEAGGDHTCREMEVNINRSFVRESWGHAVKVGWGPKGKQEGGGELMRWTKDEMESWELVWWNGGRHGRDGRFRVKVQSRGDVCTA